MGKVHKPSDSVCYTSSSDPFKINYHVQNNPSVSLIFSFYIAAPTFKLHIFTIRFNITLPQKSRPPKQALRTFQLNIELFMIVMPKRALLIKAHNSVFLHIILLVTI
jgi:hypothetical protein